MDKHDRPYIYSKSGCENRIGFTDRGDLTCHEKVFHNINGEPSLYFCGQRAIQGRGFRKKHNLTDHVRRKHPPTAESGAITSADIEKGEGDSSKEYGLGRQRISTGTNEEQSAQIPLGLSPITSQAIETSHLCVTCYRSFSHNHLLK